MMLVDSNVIMYAAGAAHPNKAPSVAFLDRVARAEIDAAIDAGVLQEILQRYRAIQRWSEGRTVCDLAACFLSFFPCRPRFSMLLAPCLIARRD